MNVLIRSARSAFFAAFMSLAVVPVAVQAQDFTVNLKETDIQELIKFVAEATGTTIRSEEHTSELQSRSDLVCRLLLEKKNKKKKKKNKTTPQLKTLQNSAEPQSINNMELGARSN